jgi:signal transduction histidine kinase
MIQGESMGLCSAEEIYQVKDKKTNRQALLALRENMSQVAHDINSPLSALDVVINSMDTISSGQQKILSHALKRIRNISADLNLEQTLKTKRLDLFNIIGPIVLEKQKLNQTEDKIVIKTYYNQCEGFTPNIDAITMKRIVSNIIQNSIEAGSSKVIVETKDSFEYITIIIRDNGKGIPHHILPRLSEKGMTFGKASGTGLGLYHAKKEIEAMDGKLFINTMDVGTKIEICLKKHLN